MEGRDNNHKKNDTNNNKSPEYKSNFVSQANEEDFSAATVLQSNNTQHSRSPSLDNYVVGQITSKSLIKESEYDGLLNAGLVEGEEELGELHHHTAMVYDCGSGESKAMLLKFNRLSEAGQRCVSVEQISSKLPPVTDFLMECKKPKDCFQFLNLQNRPTDPDEVLRPHHFVQYCVEQK
jgi:hypothetical protein